MSPFITAKSLISTLVHDTFIHMWKYSQSSVSTKAHRPVTLPFITLLTQPITSKHASLDFSSAQTHRQTTQAHKPTLHTKSNVPTSHNPLRNHYQEQPTSQPQRQQTWSPGTLPQTCHHAPKTILPTLTLPPLPPLPTLPPHHPAANPSPSPPPKSANPSLTSSSQSTLSPADPTTGTKTSPTTATYPTKCALAHKSSPTSKRK